MTAIDRRGFCAALGAAGAMLGVSGTPALARVTAPATPIPTRYPDMIGATRTYVTRYEDSLVDLARAFSLGYTELVAANPGIDPWVPGAGTDIMLPTAHILPNVTREGIVLNLADQRLYHFKPDGVTVDTAPLGIGNAGWDTPRGKTKIVRKKRNPTWYVPKSVREDQPELPKIVPPGPDNPLGAHALYLGWPAYLIHGTHKPFGVGRRVSHGCVRLYPEDIARLFEVLPVGTPVAVVDQEVKTARMGNQVWIEIHPNQLQADEIEKSGTFTAQKPWELEYKVLQAAGPDRHAIDWHVVREAARKRSGVPVPILKMKETVSSGI